jgi:hypothetical protein
VRARTANGWVVPGNFEGYQPKLVDFGYFILYNTKEKKNQFNKEPRSVSSEINLEELRTLTRNAREFPLTTKANAIIARIPETAKNAAQEGKDSVVVYSFKYDKNKTSHFDPVSQFVWDYCIGKGLSPTLRENFTLKGGETYVSIIINWG